MSWHSEDNGQLFVQGRSLPNIFNTVNGLICEHTFFLQILNYEYMTGFSNPVTKKFAM